MVTILIFSYNRPLFIKRSLAYWKDSGWSVIIADGSDRALECDFPLNVDYLHRPRTSVTDRIAEMAGKVTTPYVAFCADDDFIAFNGLREVTKFLVGNPDYSSAQGYYIRFQRLSWTSQVDWFWDYRYASSFFFAEAAFELRFSAAMKPPIMHYCYSVMRSEAMKNSLDILHGVDETSISTFELSFIPGLMSHGKHATLPIFYGARQAHPQNWRNYIRFDNWVERNSTTGYAKWRANICKLFHDAHALSEEDAGRIVDGVIQQCLDSFREESLVKKDPSKASGLRSGRLYLAIAKRLTDSQKIFIRSIYAQARSLWDLYRMLGLNPKSLSYFRNDWLRIKSIILTNPVDDLNKEFISASMSSNSNASRTK